MATLKEFIYRGEEIQLVEEYFNHPDPAERGDRYRFALERLAGDEDLSLGFLDEGERSDLEERLVEGDAVDHFRRHWLGREGDESYWPDRDGGEIAGVLRDGFRAAMEEALELDLPLTILQVAAGDQLRVGHLAGPTSITVVLAAPSRGETAG